MYNIEKTPVRSAYPVAAPQNSWAKSLGMQLRVFIVLSNGFRV